MPFLSEELPYANLTPDVVLDAALTLLLRPSIGFHALHK